MAKDKTPIEEDGDVIEISVRLVSGKFKSEIQLPLDADHEYIEAALGNWWQTLESVIKCGQSARKSVTHVS